MRNFLKYLTYRISQWALMLWFWIWFRYRTIGRRRVPRSGALLVCSNHQSFLDPMLIGATCSRRLRYLARETLFRSWFNYLIRWYDAIPVNRDGMSLSGIKATLSALKRDQAAVVMFPEGTRTDDGEVQPLKPGFITLARRGKAGLIPVAIDGAFDAWPRHRKWPRFGKRICIVFGDPIPFAQVAKLSDDDLIAELQRRVNACHAEARRKIHRGKDS